MFLAILELLLLFAPPADAKKRQEQPATPRMDLYADCTATPSIVGVELECGVSHCSIAEYRWVDSLPPTTLLAEATRLPFDGSTPLEEGVYELPPADARGTTLAAVRTVRPGVSQMVACVALGDENRNRSLFADVTTAGLPSLETMLPWSQLTFDTLPVNVLDGCVPSFSENEQRITCGLDYLAFSSIPGSDVPTLEAQGAKAIGELAKKRSLDIQTFDLDCSMGGKAARCRYDLTRTRDPRETPAQLIAFRSVGPSTEMATCAWSGDIEHLPPVCAQFLTLPAMSVELHPLSDLTIYGRIGNMLKGPTLPGDKTFLEGIRNDPDPVVRVAAAAMLFRMDNTIYAPDFQREFCIDPSLYDGKSTVNREQTAAQMESGIRDVTPEIAARMDLTFIAAYVSFREGRHVKDGKEGPVAEMFRGMVLGLVMDEASTSKALIDLCAGVVAEPESPGPVSSKKR
jgi:hypothetical protein